MRRPSVNGEVPGGVSLRILLVDDDELLRDGLEAALHAEPLIEVIGTACTVAEALTLAVRHAPDLIITDLHIGGQSAIELIDTILKEGSTTRVLVLTSESNEAKIRLAMSAGACGYLLKEDGYSELVESLRVVSAGLRFFSATVESAILAQYAERVAARFAVCAALITPRERDVLARIGQGQTNKAIANALCLSVKTVEKHRSNLMRKLGLHNTAGVTVYAIRQGLVNQDKSSGSL